MSRNYDNWERLVAAVIKRREIWELCHQHSRSPSICSEASSSDFSSSFRLSDANLEDMEESAQFNWERLGLVGGSFTSTRTLGQGRFGASNLIEGIRISDHEFLAEGTPKFHSKKDLYLHLCDHPILIDEGRKSFSLEKLTGKKCYMLAAKDLIIVWGDDTRYWQWMEHPRSRFSEVAELLDVCWFEVRGKINIRMLSSGTNYAAYLVFTCKSGTYGFKHQTAEASVGISGHECEKRNVCLDQEFEQMQRFQLVPRRVGLFRHRLVHERENIPGDQNREYPKQRNDGYWMEVELGEWFVNGGEDGDFEVGLMEVKDLNWKSGLVIQGIEIRPKESK